MLLNAIKISFEKVYDLGEPAIIVLELLNRKRENNNPILRIQKMYNRL